MFPKIESQTIEYKENLDYKSIAKIITSFANSNGGVIYIGVKDDGEVKGIDIGKNTIEELSNQIRNRIDPTIYPVIETLTENEKTIITIKVQTGLYAPYFCNGAAYKRVGSTNSKMTSDEIKRLIKENSTTGFDFSIAPKSTLNDISPEKVKEFLNLIDKNYDVNDFLLTRNCARYNQDKELIPTIAGILLFGKIPQTIIPQSYITIVDYTVPIKSEKKITSYRGTLLDQLKAIIRHIKSIHPPKDFLKKNDIRRQSVEPIPTEVLREVVVNSLVHRVYEDYGRKTLIKVYKEKVVVSNPAYLPESINVKDLETYQRAYNPIISRIFFEGGYVEEIGEGIDKILRWANSTYLQKEPVLQYKNNELIVTLYLNKPELEAIEELNLNNRQRKILKLMSDGSSYTTSELARRLDVSNDTILNDLAELEKHVNIKEEGASRSTRYRWQI